MNILTRRADDVVKEVITHCEQDRFRLAVVDSPSGVASVSSLNPRDDNDSRYGAIYYPWIVISDPCSSARKTVPPGGFVCGIYARSDVIRGVFKAPVNESLAGAIVQPLQVRMSFAGGAQGKDPYNDLLAMLFTGLRGKPSVTLPDSLAWRA